MVWGGRALHRVFGDSWVKTITKAAAIAIVYGASLFVVSLAILGSAVATM